MQDDADQIYEKSARNDTKAYGNGRPTITEDLPIEKIWKDFKSSGSAELRNTLIEHYMPLVRFATERIYARLPSTAQIEDLNQAGVFGLISAIESFDLERGIRFETYSANRIRGSILDELRSMDWVPRLVRSRSRKMERAKRAYLAEKGIEPTKKEIKKRLAVNEETLDRLVRDGQAHEVHSLQERLYVKDDIEVTRVHLIPDPKQENPLAKTQRDNLKNFMIKGLSRQERLLTLLYYYEELTMKEIGRVVDLSESRVSQIHYSILDKMKERLVDKKEELFEE